MNKYKRHIVKSFNTEIAMLTGASFMREQMDLVQVGMPVVPSRVPLSLKGYIGVVLDVHLPYLRVTEEFSSSMFVSYATYANFYTNYEFYKSYVSMLVGETAVIRDIPRNFRRGDVFT